VFAVVIVVVSGCPYSILCCLKAFLYDGKSGEKKAELGSPAHKGGIYGVSDF